MTHSIPAQATHTKIHQDAVSPKIQTGSPKPDISKSNQVVTVTQTNMPHIFGLNIPSSQVNGEAAFKLGDVYVTRSLLEVLGEEGLNVIAALLDMYKIQLWGVVDLDTVIENNNAVLNKGFILASYVTTYTDLWIVTDEGHIETMVCLPEE